MYAVTITSPGGPEVLTWSEVPDPEVRAGEVLIDVRAAGVNRPDLVQRAGHYPPPPGAPPYLGLECSGVVVEVGPGVTEWSPGDEVCALLSGGGYAERVAVPAGQVFPVPRGVSLVDAAGLPEVACTVWSNLLDMAALRAGETLLVHGGGGGIGTFAIQLAAALGVRVITTARKEKHATLRRLGADVTVDYQSEDFVAVAKEVTDGCGVDVILDIMGAAYFERNLACLARYGRLMIIGVQGGRRADLDLARMLMRGTTIAATTLRQRPDEDKERVVRGTHQQVWPLIAAGSIAPVVDRYLPMAEAAEAHRIMAASSHVGKIILTRS